MATCQTCRGERYVVKEGQKLPCPRCGGTGIEHCCDGEDVWQEERSDD